MVLNHAFFDTTNLLVCYLLAALLRAFITAEPKS